MQGVANTYGQKPGEYVGKWIECEMKEEHLTTLGVKCTDTGALIYSGHGSVLDWLTRNTQWWPTFNEVETPKLPWHCAEGIQKQRQECRSRHVLYDLHTTPHLPQLHSLRRPA